MSDLKIAFDAMLDAASASVSSVTPSALSSSNLGTKDAGKSPSFVSFDDLVVGSLGGSALAGAGGVSGHGDDGKVEGISGGSRFKSDDDGTNEGEDDEFDAKCFAPEEAVVDGPHLVFVGDSGASLCRASPPGLSKWCFDCDCKVKSHTKHGSYVKVEVATGLYLKVKGPSMLAFVTPHVPFEYIWRKGYGEALLNCATIRSVHEWDLIFQLINLRRGEFSSLSELEEELVLLRKNADAFKTPLKATITSAAVLGDGKSFETEERVKEERKSLREDLSKFKTVMESDDGNGLAITTEGVKQLQDFMSRFLSTALSDDSMVRTQDALRGLQDQQNSTMAKVVDILAALGERTKAGSVQSSVFSELARVVVEITDLTGRLQVLEGVKTVVSELSLRQNNIEASSKVHFGKIAQVFTNVLEQQHKLEKALNQLSDKIARTEGEDKMSMVSNGDSPFDVLLNGSLSKKGCDGNRVLSGSGGGGSCANNGCNCEGRLKILRDELNQVKLELELVKTSNGSEEEVLEIGGFRFSGRDNLLLWASTNLPSIIPFGVFVDVYTFLNRMVDGLAGNGLHELVDQHRLGLSSDDAVTLESFQYSLPKLFGTSTKMADYKSSHKSWIVSMPTANYWEDVKSSMGIKDRLRKQLPNLKAQVMANINFRLGEHPVGHSLAVACLESTVSFINTLMSWVTDTHQRLTSHGYSSELSWQLVTQVLYHVFTGDLDKSRNFVRDGANTSNSQMLHSSVLWGIFKTHEAMQSYMLHGFSAHPAVAAQYMEFLVNSRGQEVEDKDSAAMKSVKQLETQVMSIEKIAKEAKSAAGTANNGVSQLKNKISNLKS